MMTPAARLQPITLDGVVKTLCHGVFNAENVAVTDSGRMFVTGGDSVYEILRPNGVRYEKQLVPVRVAGIPEPSMKNGIAAHGETLYLACARVRESGAPFLSAVLPDINEVEQTGMGLMGLYVAASLCPIDSYIVRCDLTQAPAAFTHLVSAMTGQGMANGIAVDEQGAFLYVAISLPQRSAGIYKVPLSASADQTEATLWCPLPGGKPNGLKVNDGVLHYTSNGALVATLGRVPLERDGSAGPPHTIYAASAAFDDFALGSHGFVISQFCSLIPSL